MKRFLTGLVVATMLLGMASCGSSRHGVGCPANPTNYRGR